MKHFLTLAIILFQFILSTSAQTNFVLKGKVTDQETSEGIAFVSIGIEGTYLGTATNPDGNFELKIPAEHRSGNLYLSAIGYVNKSFPISGFLQEQTITIKLVPQSYKIEEVEVAAESKVLQRILRTASERIPENYQTGPVNMKIYGDKRTSSDNLASRGEKYIFRIYDAKGYSMPSWADAFKSRTYQILEAERPQPAQSFRDASLQIDELLETDLARLANTILNPDLLSDYQLHMESKTRFNGDSVWIISYEAGKKDLAHTGSFYPESFRGKIYISISDYAILRNEIHVSEIKSNPQGRSLAVKSDPNINTQVNITVGYKKLLGKYVLAFIDSEKQYTSADKQLIYESWKLSVLEVNTQNPTVISGRDYFADIQPNPEFWKNFTVTLK
ncbi:MAG: carboxypeptidase-like regulatory domain-containing protein [Prolixibacteraceae bacterium]